MNIDFTKLDEICAMGAKALIPTIDQLLGSFDPEMLVSKEHKKMVNTQIMGMLYGAGEEVAKQLLINGTLNRDEMNGLEFSYVAVFFQTQTMAIMHQKLLEKIKGLENLNIAAADATMKELLGRVSSNH
jgi:hypothetical protein